MVQLLWKSIIPGFFVHRERPAGSRSGLFDRVSISALTKRHERVAPQHVGINDSTASIKLGGIIHAPFFRPTILDQGGRPAPGFHYQDGIVVASRPASVNVSAELSINALNRRFAKYPPGELDSVASHVEQHSAARPVDVPEPIRMGPRMLLALLDQIHLADCSLV